MKSNSKKNLDSAKSKSASGERKLTARQRVEKYKALIKKIYNQ